MFKRLFNGSQGVGIGLGSLTLAIVLLAALAGAGCASRKYVDDVLQIERQVRSAELKRLDERKADSVATATEFTKVRGEVVAAVSAEKSAREQAVSQLASRLAGTQSALVDLRQEVNDKADKKIVEKQVKAAQAAASTAAARATALTRRVGQVETTTYDHSGRKVVQLYFTTAKLNPDGSFAACAEITQRTKQAVASLVMPALKDGMNVAKISGFADARPFVDAKGKPLANTDELNAKCASARAEAAQKYLVEQKAAGADSATVKGMGKTTRFGRHDADRSVVVDLVSAPPTPPAPTVAPAPAQPPAAAAPAPAKKYTLELGPFATKLDADAAMIKLDAGGFMSTMSAATTTPATYIVRRGRFNSEAEAKVEAEEVKTKTTLVMKVIEIN